MNGGRSGGVSIRQRWKGHDPLVDEQVWEPIRRYS